MYAFSHSSVSYALFRYALYTVVTHVSYANSVTRFIPRALRSYAVTQLRILYPTCSCCHFVLQLVLFWGGGTAPGEGTAPFPSISANTAITAAVFYIKAEPSGGAKVGLCHLYMATYRRGSAVARTVTRMSHNQY